MLNFLRIRWLLSSKTLSPSIYMFSMLVAQMLRSFRTDIGKGGRRSVCLKLVLGLFWVILGCSSFFWLFPVCSIWSRYVRGSLLLLQKTYTELSTMNAEELFSYSVIMAQFRKVIFRLSEFICKVVVSISLQIAWSTAFTIFKDLRIHSNGSYKRKFFIVQIWSC